MSCNSIFYTVFPHHFFDKYLWTANYVNNFIKCVQKIATNTLMLSFEGEKSLVPQFKN